MAKQLPVEQARQQVERAVSEARPGIEWLGRIGYASKGAVYILVGVLAAQAAMGRGGATTGTEGVLARILNAPFGRFLLGVIALGLLGHAIWRFTQAGLDTEGKGDKAAGLAARAAYATTGVIYIGLAWSAVQLMVRGGGVGGDSTQSRTAWLLSRPLGRWLLGIVGLVVVGAGLYQLYRAYSVNFREKLRLREMSSTQKQWVTYVGRAGYTARGIVFGIIGGFLVVAAVQVQPEEARGLGGALETLARQQYGQMLLGLVAGGLVAYGLFMLVQARYRRMLLR